MKFLHAQYHALVDLGFQLTVLNPAQAAGPWLAGFFLGIHNSRTLAFFRPVSPGGAAYR